MMHISARPYNKHKNGSDDRVHHNGGHGNVYKPCQNVRFLQTLQSLNGLRIHYPCPRMVNMTMCTNHIRMLKAPIMMHSCKPQKPLMVLEGFI